MISRTKYEINFPSASYDPLNSKISAIYFTLYYFKIKIDNKIILFLHLPRNISCHMTFNLTTGPVSRKFWVQTLEKDFFCVQEL